METLKYQKQVNVSELIPLHGNSYIFIGMPLLELNKILWNHYSVFGEQSNDGYCMFYNITIKRSIRVSIDVLKQVIYRIDFVGDYKGTYQGIGIGSTIGELKSVRPDISFDEEYVLVGSIPYDFIIKINNQDKTISSIDEILNNKIVQITVENKSLL